MRTKLLISLAIVIALMIVPIAASAVTNPEVVAIQVAAIAGAVDLVKEGGKVVTDATAMAFFASGVTLLCP